MSPTRLTITLTVDLESPTIEDLARTTAFLALEVLVRLPGARGFQVQKIVAKKLPKKRFCTRRFIPYKSTQLRRHVVTESIGVINRLYATEIPGKVVAASVHNDTLTAEVANALRSQMIANADGIIAWWMSNENLVLGT